MNGYFCDSSNNICLRIELCAELSFEKKTKFLIFSFLRMTECQDKYRKLISGVKT